MAPRSAVPLFVSSSSTPISVLIGNLPPLVRAELVRLLSQEPGWLVVPAHPVRGRVAATARQCRAGLVVADESGMMELAELAQLHPVPVVLYSAVPLAGTHLRQAARWNVRSYFGPWIPTTNPAFSWWWQDVLLKLRMAALQKVVPSFAVAVPANASPVALPTGVVVLGGSTGGSAAVEDIVRRLSPTTSCAIVVAVHLPAHFTQTLVERLRRITSLPVVAGTTGTSLTPGKLIVVPGGGNTTVQAATGTPWISWQTSFAAAANSHANQPSIDLLMQSVARTVDRPVLGVILSGLGNDGTEGARAFRQRGGQVLAQRQAAVAAMPQSVVQAGYANQELLLSDITEYVNHFAQQACPARRSIPLFSPATRL